MYSYSIHWYTVSICISVSIRFQHQLLEHILYTTHFSKSVETRLPVFPSFRQQGDR